MIDKRQPRQGPGRFQWNVGGWFGTQLGSTAWMLIAAAVLLPKEPEASGMALLCFVLPNVSGFLLYRRRHRIAPYPAIQWLILLIGVFTTIFIVYLNHTGLVQEIDPRLVYDQWGFFLLPLLFGGVMVWFHRLERATARKRQSDRNA